jgi:hypothetical protein
MFLKYAQIYHEYFNQFGAFFWLERVSGNDFFIVKGAIKMYSLWPVKRKDSL